MQLLERPSQLTPETQDREALIKEARRLRRRRWALGISSGLLVIGLGGGLAVALSSGHPQRGLRVGGKPNATSSSSLSGTVAPKAPGALSIGSNGDLYLVDIARDQILRRLPSGRFQVVAGDGRPGFSGDGGRALHAELRLQDHSGIAVASNGTVYVSDSGNDRVRAIFPDGRIQTVAGGGPLSLPAKPGTSIPARSGDLGGVEGLAIGPDQQLYIAARFIVRFTHTGTLDWVAGARGAAAHVCSTPGCPVVEQGFQNVTDLAFDGAGNLVVSGGNLPGAGWPLAEIRANGAPIYLTANARGVGGQPAAVAPGPNGSVVIARQTGLYRISKNSRTVHPLKGGNAASTTAPLSNALTAATGTGAHRIRETFYGGDGITTGTAGQIYADARPFIGLTLDTIVQLSPTGRATVLWRS